jgi:hypothetical protein
MRIRQGAFQCVILASKDIRECRKIGLEHFETAAVMVRQCARTADDMQGCPPLRTGLGQDQRAVLEVEGEQPHLARNRGPGGFPAKAAGDHEMEHEIEVALELEDDSLSESPQGADMLPFDG